MTVGFAKRRSVDAWHMVLRVCVQDSTYSYNWRSEQSLLLSPERAPGEQLFDALHRASPALPWAGDGLCGSGGPHTGGDL